MTKYLNAVGIITLVILLPLIIGSSVSFALGSLTFTEFMREWKEPLMLLIGFWIRGAASGDSGASSMRT